ncbi:MAG: hypothetical protein ACI9OJ_003747 [Myxococcota bacterium]|jgi:hypothetical protein
MFATKKDLLPGLTRIEEAIDIQYILVGRSEVPEPEFYEHASEIPSLCIAKVGNAVQEAQYIVLPREIPCRVREVNRPGGVIGWVVDQLSNPDCAVLRPGGTFKKEAVISGEISSIGASEVATTLFRKMVPQIIGDFRRIQSYWVGPEAAKHLKRGRRLARAIGDPEKYDLLDDI